MFRYRTRLGIKHAKISPAATQILALASAIPYQPYDGIQVDGQCQVACLYQDNPNAAAACELFTSAAEATTDWRVRSCPACP